MGPYLNINHYRLVVLTLSRGKNLVAYINFLSFPIEM